MLVVREPWRPLILGLAAAFLSIGCAAADNIPLAERTAQCGGCHGEDGNSRLEKVPSLAGQPAFFVMNQLFLMRENVRRVEAMMPFVKDLKDDELTALAQHYASLEAKPSDEAIDRSVIERGAELARSLRCGSCHLPTFAGQEQMPRVAKQRVDYLIEALKSYRDNTRSGAETLMSATVAGLPDADLVALAHYSASR